MLHRLLHLFPLLLLAFLAVSGVRVVHRNHSQSIAFKPLELDPKHSGERRLGELIFLNAWELGSDNSGFGGISTLTALPDGRFVGLSDAGVVIGFGLKNDENADRPFIAPLPDVNEHTGYADRDSEALAYNPATGQFWVSYESHHKITRFARSFARVEAKATPKLMKSWPFNGGGEALVHMSDGRFVLFSEASGQDDGTFAAILFSGDPVEAGSIAASFRYRPPLGYKVTDAALFPDGRMVMLHRKIALPYGLFDAKLALVDPSDIKPGAVVSGKVIATLAAPLLVDNMEGVAITREGNNTIIWLISDNNFNILQRTLLMKFRLAERNEKKKPEAAAAPGFESL